MAMQTRESQEKRKRTKTPKHKWEQRAYHFLLQPTPEQEQAFWHVCHGCWFLRGLLIHDRDLNRQDNRGEAVDYLTQSDQYKAIPNYQKQYPEQLKGIFSQVLQNVAVRVNEGTERWLEAWSEGNFKVKPPHPISPKKYRSFTYPQYGHNGNRAYPCLKKGVLHLPMIGDVKAVGWRKMRGLPKTVTIKFKQGKWWAIISCAIQAKDLYKPMAAVKELPDGSGDPGLESLLTDTEGTKYDPPRAWHQKRAELAHELRAMARKFRHREDDWKEEFIEWLAQGKKPPVPLKEYPYSKRLLEQIRRVAKLYTK